MVTRFNRIHNICTSPPPFSPLSLGKNSGCKCPKMKSLWHKDIMEYSSDNSLETLQQKASSGKGLQATTSSNLNSDSVL